VFHTGPRSQIIRFLFGEKLVPEVERIDIGPFELRDRLFRSDLYEEKKKEKRASNYTHTTPIEGDLVLLPFDHNKPSILIHHARLCLQG
jgi:hypothetical protein